VSATGIPAWFDRKFDFTFPLEQHADLQRKCATPNGSPIPTWKWLRSIIEQEIHHRGQLYTYLGILGVATPPLYGLTSEQAAERSAKSLQR